MAQNLNPSLGPSQAANLRPKPTKRLIPILIGGAGLILVGGGSILVGLNSKLTTLQTSAQQKDAEVSSSEQITHRYQTTLDNYNETQTHIKYLETAVSDRSYVPTLLAQVQALAAQTHLAVAAVRPTASAPVAAAAPPAADSSGVASANTKKAVPPPYDTLDVAVDVSGSYADTSTFLYDLTRFPKIVSVSSVQMHPGPPLTPGGPMVITTNLKLTAFMFHDADTTAASAGQTAAAPAGQTAAAPAGQTIAASVPANTGFVPPPAAATPAGSAGRAAFGAAGATKAANSSSAEALKTL